MCHPSCSASSQTDLTGTKMWLPLCSRLNWTSSYAHVRDTRTHSRKFLSAGKESFHPDGWLPIVVFSFWGLLIEPSSCWTTLLNNIIRGASACYLKVTETFARASSQWLVLAFQRCSTKIKLWVHPSFFDIKEEIRLTPKCGFYWLGTFLLIFWNHNTDLNFSLDFFSVIGRTFQTACRLPWAENKGH